MRPVKTPVGEVPVVSFEIEFAERIYHIVVEGTAEKRVLSWEVSSAEDPDRRIESAELFGTLRGAKWREALADENKLAQALNAF